MAIPRCAVLNALGPLHEAIAANLGASAAAWLQERLLEACWQPRGLAHLERPDLADELASARTFDLGLGSPQLHTAMPQIGNGFAEILVGVGQAIVLGRYHWWASLMAAWANATREPRPMLPAMASRARDPKTTA